MLRSFVSTLCALLLLAGCGRGGDRGPAATASAAAGTRAASGAAAAKPTLLLAAEDVHTVALGTRASGPVITGSIQPEQRADLRAEVSAVVLQVLKENGEAVRRGELLLRLDDAAIRDNLASANESQRASGQAFEQAERTVQRLKTLQAQGMTSMQVLEDAEVRRNNAQSDLLAAKARAATARQQLSRTEVRAPFDGVVSERKVSVGDTVQAGKELVKVIDPRSMRFEGMISADRIAEVQVGQKVSFRVNGYPGVEFAGGVRRVDASANAATRQLVVLVGITGSEAPRVAGLFAEGRIETGQAQVLSVAEASLVREGDSAFAWQLKGTTLHKAPLTLGERDERSGEVAVLGGLAAGDRILRRPSGTLVQGQAFEWARPAVPASPATAASAASTATR
jgi:RND family efflux transporter MFP subunit